MVKLIHAVSRGDMWVHESRVHEYLAAGHKLAAPPKVEEKQPAAKKSTKKTTTK